MVYNAKNNFYLLKNFLNKYISDIFITQIQNIL